MGDYMVSYPILTILIVGLIILIVFIYGLISAFRNKIKDVQDGKVNVVPTPAEITTKDRNVRIRYTLGIMILIGMCIYLYYFQIVLYIPLQTKSFLEEVYR